MSQMTVATPYDSARLIFGSNMPTWLNPLEAARLAAYKLYEDIYWNEPNTFKLVMRGTNEHPIYIPSGRIIVNTMNRYVCRGYSVGLDPDREQDDLLVQAFKAIFKRLKFMSMFNTNKLYGIMRGDSCYYITANDDKPDGSKVDINTLDPASVFWIEDPDNSYRNIGVDIIEQLVHDTTLYVKRQRYLKSDHPDHPSGSLTSGGEISYQVDSFEVQDWEDPLKQKRFVEGETLPAEVIPGITHLPVYHHKNMDQPENTWGISEMRGIETLIAGVNQAASDQDLALAIAGLGQYVTDAGEPEGGTWGLGPAEVVEVATGKTFKRINGITTVDPSLNHIGFLQEQAFRTSGTSDVAQGQVEVKMAESGIALQLRMGPLLDEAAIKDTLICDTMDQLYYDLRQWLDVYEGTDFMDDDEVEESEGKATMISLTGDKLPENKEARFKALMAGYNAIPAIFSGSFVRAELRRMGWDIPEDKRMMQDIMDEANFFTDVTEPDPEGDRLQEEADAEDEPEPPADE